MPGKIDGEKVIERIDILLNCQFSNTSQDASMIKIGLEIAKNIIKAEYENSRCYDLDSISNLNAIDKTKRLNVNNTSGYPGVEFYKSYNSFRIFFYKERSN